MSIKILFFASLRELSGQSRFELEINPSEEGAKITTFDVQREVESMYPKLVKYFDRVSRPEESFTNPINIAVNGVYCKAGEATELKDGDTVAFIPPIAGG